MITATRDPVLAPTPELIGFLEWMGTVMYRLNRELAVAHAENLALRDLLTKQGIEAETPRGVASLARLRALENVLDLTRMYLRHRTKDLESALREATVTAGRAP